MKKDNFCRDAVITRVIDGDTVKARIDLGYDVDRKVIIRFLGIDTPESYQEGFDEATNFTKEAVIGQKVVIESIRYEKGGFGRYLGRIYIEDDNSQYCLNDMLLSKGLAEIYQD